jgi:hypothetical protein
MQSSTLRTAIILLIIAFGAIFGLSKLSKKKTDVPPKPSTQATEAPSEKQGVPKSPSKASPNASATSTPESYPKFSSEETVPGTRKVSREDLLPKEERMELVEKDIDTFCQRKACSDCVRRVIDMLDLNKTKGKSLARKYCGSCSDTCQMAD